MQSRQEAIGRVFQDQLERRYSFLKINRTGSNLPDFETDDFYLEAKGSYFDYGGRIKPMQVVKFRKLEKPVFYAYGFHNFRGLAKMKRKLAFSIIPNLRFQNINIVDNQLIERFFEKEQRFTKKEGLNVDKHYCILKPRHFRQIIENRPVSRNKQIQFAQDFYGINKEEWNFDKIGEIQLLVSQEHRNLMEVFYLS